MFLTWIRKNFTWLIVVIAVTFGVGLLYVGGQPLFSKPQQVSAGAIIGSVNGKDITDARHLVEFQNVAMQYRLMGENVTRADEGFLRYQAFEQIVNTHLITEAAKKAGIKVTKAEIDDRIAQDRAQFGSDAEFKNFLNQIGLTEKEYRADIESELLFRAIVDTKRAEVSVTDEEIAELYESVTARHILIRPEVVDGEQDWEAAEQLAADLLAQLHDGADFAVLAEEYSDDGSAVRGGDLGSFRRGQMVPEFEEAAFALAEGELSDLVRSQFGYHIIQVTEWQRAEGEEFETEKEDVRQYLKMQKEQQVLEAWLQGLKADARIEIKDPLLNAYHHVINGQIAPSIAYFEQASALDPDNGYIDFVLSQVYLMLGDNERALTALKTAAHKEKHDAMLFYTLGIELLNTDQQDEAVEALMQASEWAPNEFMLQSEVLDILVGLDYPEEATIVEERLEDIFQRMMAQQQLQEEQARQLEDPQYVQQLLDEAAAAGAQDKEQSAPADDEASADAPTGDE